jgi:hypothetical protein
VFEWHPEYAGRTLEKVTRDLESEIARDQRSYEIALMGAEESEHDALASVVDVERRWSPFHFGWNETDPAELAQRIAAFEWEREQRREMISWQEYRSGNGNAGGRAGSPAGGRSDWRASMSDEQRRKIANGLAAAIVGLIVIGIIVVVVLML